MDYCIVTSQEYSPASARAAEVMTSECAEPDDEILKEDDSVISVLFLNLGITKLSKVVFIYIVNSEHVF